MGRTKTLLPWLRKVISHGARQLNYAASIYSFHQTEDHALSAPLERGDLPECDHSPSRKRTFEFVPNMRDRRIL
jgi:hypothetical protein